MTRLFLICALGLAVAPLYGCAADVSGDDVATETDESDLTKLRTYTGSFLHMFAIGGETTGTWLLTDGGSRIELDLATNGFSSKFEVGKRVTVKGRFKTIHGVEIKRRSVLVVTKVTVLGGVTEADASVLTDDATQIVVENHGGGFAPPAPAGSECSRGQEKYTLNFSTRRLSWTICDSSSAPFQKKSGSRLLKVAQVASLRNELLEIKVFGDDTCGADKPYESVTVTTPDGSFHYRDAFYKCGDTKDTWVFGIDAARSALAAYLPK